MLLRTNYWKNDFKNKISHHETSKYETRITTSSNDFSRKKNKTLTRKKGMKTREELMLMLHVDIFKPTLDSIVVVKNQDLSDN